MIQLEKRHKKSIDALLIQFPYSFYVFGSRTKNKATIKSDLDLCVKDRISLQEYAHIKEALNNLLLPFSIDLIAWTMISADFKEKIEKDLIPYPIDPLLGAEVIELSHTLSPDSPTWPGGSLVIEKTSDYDQLFRVQKYSFSAGFGTHIDTPAHMIPGGKDLADLPLNKALPSSCTIFYPTIDPTTCSNWKLTRAMLEKFEHETGELIPDSWFVCMTGWGTRAHDTVKYQNMSPEGTLLFPALATDAVEYFIEKKIRGFGIDTLSPDCNNKDFTLHKLFLEADILIIENIKFVPHLPAKTGFLQVVPLAIQGGTESPVRLFFIHQK
jgi:kynurenine formamidase/predicted nucleotidyltransferase